MKKYKLFYSIMIMLKYEYYRMLIYITSYHIIIKAVRNLFVDL